MCGIFGYIGYRKNSSSLVFDGIKSLEYRGYDSWGVAVVSNDKVVVKKKVGKIGAAGVNELPKGTMAFGHTRWATHGKVTDINAHPHLDCTGKIAIIHNGIFENYEGIKHDLIKKSHKFKTETDTETIVHLIEELSLKLPFKEAVRAAFNQMKGSNAIIAVNAKDNSMVAVRNGSPLVIGFGENENFLASDALALLPYTKKVYFLEDNELALISDKKVDIFMAASGKKIQYKAQTLDWDGVQDKKGKFPDFMLKEIYEQPKAITSIAASGISQAKIVARMVQRAKGIYIVGCGTAFYACLGGTYIFSKIAGKHINCAVGSEFGYQESFLNKDSLVIAISQSGETMDILESVKKAKAKKAKIVSLVNVFGSSLYRLSDNKMLIGVGPERAVASTKAFSGMVAHLVLLAYALDNRETVGQKVLISAVKSLKEVLSAESVQKIKKLSGKILNSKHIYVIGRGISYPASLETALKIKEISYIHAEGLAAGEIKHGPLALVEEGTPCIAFLPNDETYGANLAGAMEMKARGGYIIGISFKRHEVFDYYIPVEDANEATIIPNVAVGQLLAYFLTIKKGLDPDKPRNLAKSVTVK